MTEGTAKFFLLQVNDALFPIGGYSHSYGLETYIQKGIVHDEDSAQEFIHKRLKYNFSYNEFMAVRLAFEYALREDLEAISRLEEIMEAGKIPRETINGSMTRNKVENNMNIEFVCFFKETFQVFIRAISGSNFFVV